MISTIYFQQFGSNLFLMHLTERFVSVIEGAFEENSLRKLKF